MKCPSCLTIMICMTAINPIPGQPGRDRMDLHCSARCGSNRCYMGVITEDPKEWVCHEYNFSFKHKNKTYYLRGYDYPVDIYHQHRPFQRQTSLNTALGDIIVIKDFIPISTGDDMHERAWELFHKLEKLVIFS
jgi:hypothetical protein